MAKSDRAEVKRLVARAAADAVSTTIAPIPVVISPAQPPRRYCVTSPPRYVVTARYPGSWEWTIRRGGEPHAHSTTHPVSRVLDAG
jgi:hypothetical protein